VADRLVRIRGSEFDRGLVAVTAELLQDGAVIVHPTETIHGYGCRYDRADSIERIRRLKGRPDTRPLILLVPDQSWIDTLCRDVTLRARALAEKFWPGALTLVFRAGLPIRNHPAWNCDTIALRQSSHPFTALVVREADLPVVSTSLGISGGEVPGDPAAFVEELLAAGAVDPGDLPALAVIDDLLNNAFRPSTVLSVAEPERVVLLREGAIPAAEIERASGIELIKRS